MPYSNQSRIFSASWAAKHMLRNIHHADQLIGHYPAGAINSVDSFSPYFLEEFSDARWRRSLRSRHRFHIIKLHCISSPSAVLRIAFRRKKKEVAGIFQMMDGTKHLVSLSLSRILCINNGFRFVFFLSDLHFVLAGRLYSVPTGVLLW